jgi:adenine deaminase
MRLDPERLVRRIRVALGQEPGDLVVTGGSVVNVFTRRIEPADVVIADGWIAGVGPGPWPARRTVPAAGQVVIPGLIDSHMHLESTLLGPAELARLIVPLGTTTVLSDSHEIGNVLGIAGIDMLIEAAAGLPLDLFFMASSCVPATSWEDAGAAFGPAQIRELLSKPRVLGLAEVMDLPAVLGGSPEVCAKIAAATETGAAIDGHAPGLCGLDLIAYVAAGMRSDHESTTVDEAYAKAALGMLVQVRDGSSAQNLDALLPLLTGGAINDAWCLVTDDIFPNDLLRQGHIDGMLRRLVNGGVDPAVAVRHAALVPARHYGLHDRGAVAPGYRADLAIVADVQGFRVETVIKDGAIVAEGGRYTATPDSVPLRAENTVHLPPLDESAFRLRLRSDWCPVIEVIADQIVTRRSTRQVRRQAGYWQFDPDHDVALVASLERHRASGRIGLGLVGGLGLSSPGALGSSVAHDSHNLIVAGTNESDMLVAARSLEERGGGFVVVSGGEVRAILPHAVAGLHSVDGADVVCRQLAELHHAARGLGSALSAPFGTLSFLALSVIPELRITTRGLFDVSEQRFLVI